MKNYRGVKPYKKLGKFCLGIFTVLIASRMMSASVFATYSASITASNSITLNASYSGNGVSVHDETINVVTNCTSGYNLTIATTGSSVLYLNGDSSNNTATISPVDNTYALSDLTHNANTWGYSMSGNSSTVGAFNALSTEPSTIKTTSETASETAIDDTFSIYYGTAINAELSPGSYQMSNSSTIDYYLTIAPSCADSTVVTFNENLDGAGAEGTDSTITDFPTTSDNITDTTNNTITLSNKRPTRSGYIFKEWNTAADGTGSYYYVDETVPMGQGGLSGFVTLYAIWVANCPADTICYNDNHADGGTMTNQSATSNANNVLTSSNFNRSGYGFAGWNTAADGTGTNYGPNQTINPGNLSSTGLTLFANWIKPSGSLQSWTSASNMNVGDVIALKDDRDNEVYAVAKLADNNVWTIENLRLIPATANITIYNTNNPTSAFITSAPSTSSTTTQCSSNNVACDDQIYYYAGNMSRTATQLPTGNTSANAWYSYGVMYNWYTATAGHGSYNSTTTSGPNNDGTMAGDICPAGWHLPTGGSSGEYNTFTTAIGGTGSTGANNIRKYPNNFIYSGDYNPQNNYPDGRGQQGRLWQSTASSNSNAYRMGYNSNSITPTNTYNKWDNFAVRCIYQGGVVPFHEVTVNLGTHVTSVSFTNANYGTQQVTSSTGTVSLRQGVEYTITSTFESGYTIDTWTTTSNGTLGSATSISTTYTVSDTATLSVSAQEAEEMSYILSYNAGNGTDAPDPDEVTSYNASHDFTITNSAPIYYGYTFTGWAETPGSSTVTYTSGDTLTVISAGAETTKTLYAVYTANSCPSGKICYYDNGADVNGGGRGTMSNQNASSNSSANLIPPNYSKTGYGFAGWATDANATPYGPNATITTPDISSTGLALYAKWIKSTGDLQTWSGCSSLTLNTTTALTDTRDNNTYAVTKLADDNCWIMENLRLDPGTATITSQNTNNPTSTFITQSNAGSGSSLSVDTMCNSDGSACFDQIQYNNNSKNRSLTQSHNTNTNSVAWYSYGVYYNWYTATAGRGTYNTSSNTTVVGDICPKKWRIPTGGSTGEFNALNTAVNSGSTNSDTGLRAYPVNFVWSGDYNNNKRNSSYSNGRIWTATAKDNNTAYRAGFATSTVTTSTNSYNKWDGFVVRCIYDLNVAEYSNVVVTFPANVTSVSFTNANYGIQTATPQNTTVSLVQGATYTLTATFASGYTLDSWANGTNSAIGSTTVSPTTFSITDDSTLTLSATTLSCNPSATTISTAVCLQDMNSSIMNSMADSTTYQLYDMRDWQQYSIAKLADGNVWMTENLNIAGGTALSSTDTDFDASYTLPTTDGWTVTDGKLVLPASATKNANDDNFTDSTQFGTNNYAYVFNSGNKTNCGSSGQNTPCYSYYSWDTVTVGSGRNISTENTDADYSICPKNWKLPTSGGTSDGGWKRGDFYVLATEYGANLESDYVAFTMSFYNNAGPNTVPNFLLAGGCYDGMFRSGGSYGYYWSSTTYPSYTSARNLHYNSAVVSSANNRPRGTGYSVRCLIKYPIHSVTISPDSHISSVTFSANGETTQTATSASPTVSLKEGKPYTITATADTGYEFASWSTTANGTLGSTSTNPTSYTIADTTTLTVSSQIRPTYNVTVNLDKHSSSIGFYNEVYGSQTVTNQNSNNDGTHTETISLYRNIEYTLSTSYYTDYTFESWEYTAGIMGDPHFSTTSYTINSAATLSLFSQEGCPSLKICYDRNDTPTGTLDGTMGQQDIVYNSNNPATVVLLASNYSNSDYGFAGWSTTRLKTDSATFRTDLDGATIYGPNETITLATGAYTSSNDGLKLYAVWIPLERDANNQELSFQTNNLLNVTLSDSGTLKNKSNGYVTALRDQRDDQVYAIAKIANNKYWMIENLRLDNTAELSNTNTNNPSLPLTNIYDPTNPSTSNYLSSPEEPDQNPWCNYENNYCVNESRISVSNTTNRASYPDSNNANIYSYGNYYNYYSASAGNYIYGNNQDGTLNGDLCPKGWMLPEGTRNSSDNDFTKLRLMAGGSSSEYYDNNTTPTNTELSNAMRSFPINFVYSGAITSITSSATVSSIYARGWGSYYISNSYYHTTTTQHFYNFVRSYMENKTSISFANPALLVEGTTIRCVTKN